MPLPSTYNTATISIKESGGSPSSIKSQIQVTFDWSVNTLIPNMEWYTLKGSGLTPLGKAGYGTWRTSLLGDIEFIETVQTGLWSYKDTIVFRFFGVPFKFKFPFTSGRTGLGMYDLYATAFSHGGIEWIVF